MVRPNHRSRSLHEDVRSRIEERALAWGVAVERTFETETSVMAFGSRGVQERASPGTSLVNVAIDGRDEDATVILADVIGQMSGCVPPARCATVQDWAKGFERYSATGDEQIPQYFVEEGHRWYLELAASQQGTRLLHGDLHHYNVLSDSRRGWLAIDPKGLVGEVEYR